MPAYSSLLHGRNAARALACISALLTLLAVEIGYRVHTERPVLVLGNWREWRIEYYTFGHRGMFDPVLGWTLQEDYASDRFNTLDRGIRRNFREHAAREGAILAVGGQFTEGGEGVADPETWPAQLEGIIGTPVLNGGVTGYAPDQIVLRAEDLMELVRPKAVIVGLVGEQISWAGQRSLQGAPKPYFLLDKGELTYHPPGPVPEGYSLPAWQAALRDALGRSAVLDVALDRLAPGYWSGRGAQPVMQKLDNDPVGVTCALLRRLKGRADRSAAPVLLFMQHQMPTIAEKDGPGEDAKLVAACATAMGIEVVDQFAGLRAIAVTSGDALRKLYVDGHSDGPLSAEGNRHAAKLLAPALSKQR